MAQPPKPTKLVAIQKALNARVQSSQPIGAALPNEKLSVAHIVLRVQLYEKILLDQTQRDHLARIFGYDTKHDCFCVDCGRHSIFTVAAIFPFGAEDGLGAKLKDRKDYLRDRITVTGIIAAEPRIVELVGTCARSVLHNLRVSLLFLDEYFFKFGQYPSMADIQWGTPVKFRRVTSAENIAELRRAIGLAAHGIGIGSFVYLRRIFERLIEDNKSHAERKGRNFEDWQGKRMNERILLLRDYLPAALVENKDVYKVLSTGIHSLDESTCLRYFPTLREAIFLILERDEHAREEREREESIRSEVARLSAEGA